MRRSWARRSFYRLRPRRGLCGPCSAFGRVFLNEVAGAGKAPAKIDRKDQIKTSSKRT
jgi:hypothetical protein